MTALNYEYDEKWRWQRYFVRVFMAHRAEVARHWVAGHA